MPTATTLDIERFKALKRQIDLLVAELEKEAILDGYDVNSEEFGRLIVLIKEKVLSSQGISLQEYEEAEEELNKENPSGFSDLLNILKPPEIPHIPTIEEIRGLAMQVLPAPQIIRNTEVIERIVREKPITQINREIVREIVREVDKSALDALQKDLVKLQSAFGEVLKMQETGQEIDGEVESLRDEVARLTRIVKSYPGAGGFLGVRLSGEGTMQSYVELKAGSNITLSRDGKIVTIASTGGTGWTIETPTGTVDGSNTAFTVTVAPKAIISDGITYYENNGYTLSGLNVTMTVAPSQYIRAYV